MTTKLRASVHYNDWEGTAAADGTEFNALTAYLKSKSLLLPGELLVGVTLRSHLIQGNHPSVTIKALVAESRDYDVFAGQAADGAHRNIHTREMGVSTDFLLSLFKQFNFALTLNGLDLEEQDIIEN